MKVFDAYAKYYDLLYKEKNYKSEADYVTSLIQKYMPEAESILDLGCGTGKHDICFSENNFKVTGVEQSEKMILLADLNKKNTNVNFVNGDIRNVRLNKKYDVIISLFHVINYQSTNEDLRSTFKTVKEHLNPRGKFIFDFWYGPAVLSDRPVNKVRSFKDDECIIERITQPDINVNGNYVDVNFKISVREVRTDSEQKIEETHRMRYLFLPELNLILDELDMNIDHTEEWMSGKALTDKSWYGLAVCGIRQQ